MSWQVNDSWKREIQRDVLALGSPVFYFLVVGRALVGPFWDLFNPLILLAPVLYWIAKSNLEANVYISRGMLIGTVTTFHYESIAFGTFAAVVLVLMVYSALSLGKRVAEVRNGTMFGIAVSITGAFIARISG